jgi:hypothetical protein
LLDGVFAYPASSAAEQQPVAGAPADLVHAARALQAPASFAPLAQSAAREADEVRIHIGRIEVTAVAPAPARPAAPMPRHKAPSLEDYLKRRNGECS